MIHRSPPALSEGVGSITIGIVNNMPDAALESTERQFDALLTDAGRGLRISRRMFALPDIPRGDTGRQYVDRNYESFDALLSADLDGLIVTGTQPRTPELSDEPYWPALTKLIDWAEMHTISTIWSCLAAHAAVLYLDGIRRRPLSRKLTGVFECVQAESHEIVACTAARWHVPHSRHNDLPETALGSNGYRVLSRSTDAGVDMFVKQGNSMFLFFQGHPEYDPGALRKEYCRDIRQFLNGKASTYPDTPPGCFDESAGARLDALRRRAIRNRHADVLPEIFATLQEAKPLHAWADTAVLIYRNWIDYVASQKCRQAALPMLSSRLNSYQASELREMPAGGLV